MEKLQAAIEKARKQRDDAAPARGRGTTEKRSSPDTAAQLWDTLRALEVSEDMVKKNRLVAFSSTKVAGSYDMLRTRMVQQARSNDWKRVAIISPHSGCGKTTTSANLVASFSRQTDQRAMVMDLDMRRPSLASMLGWECVHTMGDVLQGKISFAEHGCRYDRNVALGMNKQPVKNASEILQSQMATEILNQIEADYAPDITLYEMPPLMGTDDNIGFLKNVDCALLLAEAEKTTVDQVDAAERQLAELTNVMGVVLNKSHYTSSAYGYGYGYGHA
jgi:Mrp family chromosome partitioning ATPase